MPGPLRIGIVGIGFGQHVHLPAFRSNRHCRVTAIGASTTERAEKIATQHHIPKAYGDWKSLVRDPQIDAVSIAVPPKQQYAIAMAALKLRKPVFCEKPLALTARETLALKNQARQSRTPAMVNFEFPDIDVWKKAKALLDSKKLGRLRHLHVSWHVQSRAFQPRSHSWKMTSAQGGGVLSGFASHTFYYLEYLMGPIKKLSAQLYDTSHQAGRPGAETLVVLHLEFSNNLPASVTISNHAFQPSGHRVEIYGDKGTLKLINEGHDYAKGFFMQYAPIHSAKPIEIKSALAKDPRDGRLGVTEVVVNRFVRWIREGVPARPNASDGHRVQTLIEAARDSYRRQKWINT